MEWNWYRNGNNVTPFLLYESSGDSEEVKSDIHHHHEDLEAAMDESEDVLFQFNDDVDVDDVDDDDDDAQSCSYDHSSYINRSYDSSHQSSHRLIYVDDDAGDIDEDDDGDTYDDDDDAKNWGESKLMDSCKQQKTSHICCVDSSNQGEIDRKFWEACLGS